MPRATRDYSKGALTGFNYGTFTLCGAPFQVLRLPVRLVTPPGSLSPTRNYIPQPHQCSANRLLSHQQFGLLPVRSPLLGESLLLSTPPGTKMFQFPRYRSHSLIYLGYGCRGITRNRLPHSEIPGSKLACSSPRLIAANHVLLRLLAPRHPP